MGQRRYKEGTDRKQGYLLPARIDEYVSESNPVRAIDIYVESLELSEFEFTNTSSKLTRGQRAYDPKGLLKLYLYGYLNRVRSSRRLEAECQRNVEVMWLLGGMQPSYKTIANFRKDNLKSLKAVNQDFVEMCKGLDLFGAELVGIDGSYFRGNVAKGSIYSQERLQRSLERIEEDIAGYLEELNQVDQKEEGQARREIDLQAKLEELCRRQAKRKEQLRQLADSGETQIAEADPDARLLCKNGQGVAGYNVQIAVDAKHKLIVVGEVTQDGNDSQQAAPMGLAAKQALGVEKLESVQDVGYFNGEQIKACVEGGLTPYIPEQDRQRESYLQGRFPRQDFRYDPNQDCYICPSGETLAYHTSRLDRARTYRIYRSSRKDCIACPLQKQCLTEKAKRRTLWRWEHEAVVEAHRQRMALLGAEMMRKRRELCEHPFGTLKLWLGWTHFLVRGLEKVRAEWSLLMMCYNFKRVLSILGQAVFRTHCLARTARMLPARA